MSTLFPNYEKPDQLPHATAWTVPVDSGSSLLEIRLQLIKHFSEQLTHGIMSLEQIDGYVNYIFNGLKPITKVA